MDPAPAVTLLGSKCPSSMVDTGFKMHSDSRGRDPDLASPTLRRYHKILWSKPLPFGEAFELRTDKAGCYLYHESALGKFALGSDCIAHSYRRHARKSEVIAQVGSAAQELYEKASTIAGYVVFPCNKVGGEHAINQARGVNRLLDDRFDLALECIRRFYAGLNSPLGETLGRYEDFFALFGTFADYARFFLLDDLVDASGDIRFYLPFDDFKSPPLFPSPASYLQYKAGVESFLAARSKKIESYAATIL